jgi:anti-sigma factor RsiW
MHRVVETNIEAYLDGTLATPERREMESHLRACTKCATEVDEARRTHEWMETLIAPPQAPGPDFYARIRMNIEAESERRENGLAGLFPVFGRQLSMAVVMLLLLLCGFLLTVYHNEQRNATDILLQSQAQAETPPLNASNNPQMNRELVMRAIVAPVSASEGD